MLKAAQISRVARTARVSSGPLLAVSTRSYSKKQDLESSRVPSSQFERIYHYGSLVTSLGFGALGEGVRRMASGDKTSQSSVFLGPQNLERLVRKLSRMRGAALKIGQLISFQDEKVVPKEIQQVLAKLQSRANYMPRKQLEQVLVKGLGPQWRSLFSEFDEKPIAAASIGQVHQATLPNGTKVAVKVQYPGVANSIDSDLKTISLLLLGSSMLPEGMFLDKTIDNAREELAWECDYERELENTEKFAQLLAGDPAFKVPKVYREASSKTVLTMEFLEGQELNKIEGLDQSQRDIIATNIMRLCLEEIAQFKFMQTDPNWANFLYDSATSQLGLLDFGASRHYDDKFIENYTGILKAAVAGDREAIADYSLRLGYFTGYESQAMKDAHIDSILVLAEPFKTPGLYDFHDQTVTERVRGNISLMLRERLTPPPEETYGLHRKLSGVFLLCARLGAKVPCGELFEKIVSGKATKESRD